MDLHKVSQQYNKPRAETSICVTNNDGVVDGVSKESYFWGIVTVWKKENIFRDTKIAVIFLQP